MAHFAIAAKAPALMGHVVQLSTRQVVVEPGRIWIALLNVWLSFITAHTNAYRPEEHYMRGPGPRCREKTHQLLRTHCEPTETLPTGSHTFLGVGLWKVVRGTRSHELVAFARRSYQVLPIKYRHLPSATLNQSRSL